MSTTEQPTYIVTRRFTDGHLEGLTHTGQTSVAFEVGEQVSAGAWTGPGYIVEKVEVQRVD